MLGGTGENGVHGNHGIGNILVCEAGRLGVRENPFSPAATFLAGSSTAVLSPEPFRLPFCQSDGALAMWHSCYNSLLAKVPYGQSRVTVPLKC